MHDRKGRAQRLAEDLLANHPAPGLALAVANARGVRWSAALGHADLEHGVPASAQHLFRLGSVSKAITATLAARLVSRGVVELDTPISYWLPDLPAHHRATTLAQLLTHRGGVRHYTPADSALDRPGGPVMTRPHWTRQQVLDCFVHDDLVAPPGTLVSYSSWGYSLAAIVLEAAAAAPFLDLVAQEIAGPLALPSLCADAPAALIPGRVRGYQGAAERDWLRQMFPDVDWPAQDAGWANAAPVNPAFCWAGAGLLATMPDLARFGAAHLPGAPGPIGQIERQLLFTRLTHATANSPPLGLGWRIDHDAAGRLRWHHAGATPGGRASLVVYPEAGLSIALASNCMTAPGDVLGPSAALADVFAP